MATPQTPEPVIGLAGDLAWLLAAVERKVSARLTTVLQSAGSSIEQWRVLSVLADNQGHTMTELAECALLPAPTLTKVVDRMAAANLVHRRVDEEDRRRVLALLTPRGRTVHESLKAAMEQEESGLFTLLGQDTEELRFLLTRANRRLI
ncbi:MarR family winged helix-turn-helix transcriptional regulator [Streptomyces prunicolor]|uniref:MarR family transcriptional regulator n=1 Tax=Streptomyces prunicolor TaxID=67348 RepID=A0ABU4FE38_9ACTN|nr:MarR family transcriptional regulator [Streptomyces prunicolor]MDV7218860.1 MarR family transcriptional regulator [Streptomyces prunicolor]